MCVSGELARKELQHSAHVLDKPREFVKIFRHREVEFCHALDVLLREARGRVGRLELHLHKGAGVIRGFSPDRCCSGERLGTATEEAEGPWPVRCVGRERSGADCAEAHGNERVSTFGVPQEVVDVVLYVGHVAKRQDVRERLDRAAANHPVGVPFGHEKDHSFRRRRKESKPVFDVWGTRSLRLLPVAPVTLTGFEWRPLCVLACWHGRPSE
ncbi:hypothetical protein MHU86_12679 [Fragilaria crotonensis]|nr:hypothetical protein MHU86_12679 [Fragilaria crotonensis]